MDKAKDMIRTRRLANGLLVLMALLFVFSLFLPPQWYWQLFNATSEAALVGALADWFAVSALFRRIPIPIIGRHTAIIAKNKSRIATNLGHFVEDRFFNASALNTLITQFDPAAHLATRLQDQDNAQRFAQQLQRSATSFFSAKQPDNIGPWLAVMLRRLLHKLDLHQVVVVLLKILTRANRHQALLDTAIQQLVSLLKTPTSRQFIAQHVNQWFKEQYPLLKTLVPSDWLGEKSADKLTHIIDNLLLQVAEDHNHQLRRSFNRAMRVFIQRLQHDEKMAQQVTQFKHWLIDDKQLSDYLNQLWNDMRLWVSKDSRSSTSLIHRQLVKFIGDAGKMLDSNPALSATLNQHVRHTLIKLAPEVTQFLITHIEKTINGWDDKQLSQQIEVNIGRDLQFIRINGCVVGGLIGMVLFLIAHLVPLCLPALRWLKPT